MTKQKGRVFVCKEGSSKRKMPVYFIGLSSPQTSYRPGPVPFISKREYLYRFQKKSIRQDYAAVSVDCHQAWKLAPVPDSSAVAQTRTKH